jgi:alpha-beta hydrolase superfamily lysophospholipase
LADESIRTLDELGSPELCKTKASDGYEWHYRRYAAKGELRARLIVLHGIQSHGGWYPRSCSQLANAGFEVNFLERRGCGLNDVKRGDAPSFRRLLDDIGEFIDAMPNDKPRILIGISWGGKTAAAFQYRHPGRIDGLALLCPGFFPVMRPGFFQRLWIGRCAFRNPTKLFPIPLNDPALFTESERWRDYLRNDPLALHEATARMMFLSNSIDIYLKRARKRVRTPTLLMLAEKDRIIDNAKTRRFVEKFRVDKKILEYPGAHHTLEFEAEDHPFVGDLIAWLGDVSQKPVVRKQ